MKVRLNSVYVNFQDLRNKFSFNFRQLCDCLRSDMKHEPWEQLKFIG